jgi:hypothetical protein
MTRWWLVGDDSVPLAARLALARLIVVLKMLPAGAVAFPRLLPAHSWALRLPHSSSCTLLLLT